jgi:hypothetical protein
VRFRSNATKSSKPSPPGNSKPKQTGTLAPSAWSIAASSPPAALTTQRTATPPPIHLGYLRDFDGGLLPRPVVDDDEYFLEVGQYEEVWE